MSVDASELYEEFKIVLNVILCVSDCREQDDLMRQVEDSVSEQERKELQSEQERLLLKMERKGEQISKLYKHKTQVSSHSKHSSHTTTLHTQNHSGPLLFLVFPFR